MGASVFQAFTGKWVQYTHNYYGPFFCSAIAYVVSVAIMHALSPDLRPVVLPADDASDASDPYAKSLAT
jgi:hypothetical protein